MSDNTDETTDELVELTPTEVVDRAQGRTSDVDDIITKALGR